MKYNGADASNGSGDLLALIPRQSAAYGFLLESGFDLELSFNFTIYAASHRYSL